MIERKVGWLYIGCRGILIWLDFGYGTYVDYWLERRGSLDDCRFEIEVYYDDWMNERVIGLSEIKGDLQSNDLAEPNTKTNKITKISLILHREKKKNLKNN